MEVQVYGWHVPCPGRQWSFTTVPVFDIVGEGRVDSIKEEIAVWQPNMSAQHEMSDSNAKLFG